MKNFSNLLDTDHTITVSIGLSVLGNPLGLEAKINDIVLHSGALTNNVNLVGQIKLLEPLVISLDVSGKDYNSDSESAILIQHLCIDGFEILPKWTQYATYVNDHNFQDPTTHLGFNGVWKLDTRQSFYRWRHVTLGNGWLLSPETLK